MEKVKFLFTGDFCPINGVEKLFLNKEYEKVYGDFLPILKDKDFSISNLECPLTLGQKKLLKAGPNLKANPKCIEGIKYGDFDIVTLANNHLMDYSEQGLNDTINLCKENGIEYVGAANNLNEASKIFYIEKNGIKFAILNFCENEFGIAKKEQPGVNPLNPITNYYQIKEAKNNADHVIIIIHGGIGHYNLPSPERVSMYRLFADFGGTIIISHHSHAISGYEIYNNVPIFYGLGNFLFDFPKYNSSTWFEGFIVESYFSKNKLENFSLIPYYQCKDSISLAKMNDMQTKLFNEKVIKYSKIISNDKLLDEEWSVFLKNNYYQNYKKIIYLNSIFKILYRLKIFRIILFKFINKRLLLNLIRCEAHREIIISTLEKDLNN
ncbi:MAG: CapA family protein [Ignavibacteriales bacterium]|nr:CapA family protein [Ignavibacteriales bacterium]